MQSAFVLLRIFSVAIVLIAGPAYAQNFNLPWCATIYTQGTTQCTYYTQQECLEALSGLGGECTANPSAGPSTLAPSAPPPGAILGPPMDLGPGPPPGLDGTAGTGPPP
jgi:hypothetical protein